MSAPRRIIASGLVGLIVALSLVALIAISGVPPVRQFSTSSVTAQGGSVETTSVSTSTSQTGVPTSVPTAETGTTVTTTTSSQGQASGAQGVLSLLMTDPPHVPTGVTAIYAYYIGLAVHGAQGWTTVAVAGEIELLGTVNVAQTLASTNLPGGRYDQVTFELTSALVTYEGTNYTAIVQGGHLTIRIQGDTLVTASQPAATLIDVQPIVMNVGTESNPQFVLWAEARAFPVPSAQVSETTATQGYRFSLKGLDWWDSDVNMANTALALSGVSLSANSLSLNVADTGTSGTWLKLVAVSEANPTLGITGEDSVPSAMIGAAVFVILDNGSLIQFVPILHISMPMAGGENQASVLDALRTAGYNLTAGSSAHLSYSGTIELSFGVFAQPSGISSGQTYWVTVVGDNVISSTEVTAT